MAFEGRLREQLPWVPLPLRLPPHRILPLPRLRSHHRQGFNESTLNRAD